MLADKPDGMIALRGSNIDSWIEYSQLNRDVFYWFLGVGGAAATGVGFTIWYLKKRY